MAPQVIRCHERDLRCRVSTRCLHHHCRGRLVAWPGCIHFRRSRLDFSFFAKKVAKGGEPALSNLALEFSLADFSIHLSIAVWAENFLFRRSSNRGPCDLLERYRYRIAAASRQLRLNQLSRLTLLSRPVARYRSSSSKSRPQCWRKEFFPIVPIIAR